MGINDIPKRIPLSLTHGKSVLSLKKKLWIIAKTKVGKNKSFMCSHVDSLTPDINAASLDLSVHSYKKWSRVPKNEDNENPRNWNSNIERFILVFIPSFSVFTVLIIFTNGSAYSCSCVNGIWLLLIKECCSFKLCVEKSVIIWYNSPDLCLSHRFHYSFRQRCSKW